MCPFNYSACLNFVKELSWNAGVLTEMNRNIVENCSNIGCMQMEMLSKHTLLNDATSLTLTYEKDHSDSTISTQNKLNRISMEVPVPIGTF